MIRKPKWLVNKIEVYTTYQKKVENFDDHLSLKRLPGSHVMIIIRGPANMNYNLMKEAVKETNRSKKCILPSRLFHFGLKR